jgi:hypothetical protein
MVLAFAPRWVEELAARYNTVGSTALGDHRRQNGPPSSLGREWWVPVVAAALVERDAGEAEA